MSGIFISYRREDSSYIAGRLHDQLSELFGDEHIFRDVDTIRPGMDFAERIDDAVGSCDALVAVIGNDWLAAKDPSGGRRLDSANDFVRLEIAAALDRGILVVPVLVENARMPAESELPSPIKSLSRRNALDLSDARWDYEVQRLVEELEQVITVRSPARAAPTGAAPTAPQPQAWSPPAGSYTPSGDPPGDSGASPRSSARRSPALTVGAAVIAMVAAVVGIMLVWPDQDDEAPADTARSALPLESIGLTASDVPIGWTTNPPAVAHFDTPFGRCVGGPDQRTWPRVASQQFVGPAGQAVASAAMRAPTPEAAANLIEAYEDSFLTCARANADDFKFTPGANVRSVERHDVSPPSNVRAVAFRFVIEVRVETSTTETIIDIVHLQYAELAVEMALIGNGQPFPSDGANEIIQAVARRMV